MGRTYAALLCPAGTFTLVDDLARARATLSSWFDHLEPGGVLALTLDGAQPPAAGPLAWRVRRTGTLADGTTVVVHEAVHVAEAERLVVAYNRVEAYDGEGRLSDAWLRRHHLRWWPRPELEAVLASLGFVDLRAVGDDDGWVSIATRP